MDRGTRRGRAAVLAGALALAAGCESQPAARGGGEERQAPARTVELVVEDAGLRAPNVLPAGTHTLVITNNTLADRELRVEGRGARWEVRLPAGQTQTAVVAFRPGDYRFHAPEAGGAPALEVPLTVTE